MQLSISAVWRQQVTSGERPPGLSDHSLTLIDGPRALLFGGWDRIKFHNDAYILDLDNWVRPFVGVLEIKTVPQIKIEG